MIVFAVAIAVFLALHLAVMLPRARRRFPRIARGLTPAVLVVDSLLIGVLVLECYFAAVHDQSDGFNLTYSGRKWFERHWKPLNSWGFRDQEIALPAPGQKSLVVLGDSFAAGHGIKRAEDRFSDLLAKSLGRNWRVYNASIVGWDTVDELQALKNLPFKPDVVVLAYYLNDIFNAAQQTGFPLHFAVRLPGGALKTLLEHSALADFVYWRFSRGGNLPGGAQSFWEALQGAYGDSAVWTVHARELDALSRYCADNHIRLVAVVFPMLQAPGESAPLTAKVSAQLTGQGAEVIDLSPVLNGRLATSLVVNAFDAHPNEALHSEVAALLLERIKP